MKIKIKFGGKKRRPKLFIVPAIRFLGEVSGVVHETPQFYGKAFGRLLMAFSMSDSQQVVLGPITFVDKKGNPAPQPAGSTITWAVDNVALVALTPTPDNLSATAASVGPLGTATISVKVTDASSTTLAAGSVDCTITGGNATVINIPVGTPTEQP